MTRSYGSGAIHEVRPGVWRLRVRAGVDPLTGRRRVVSETFHGGAKAAQARLGALVARHAGQRSSAATVGELMVAWLDTTTVAAGTLANYRRAVDRFPAPMLRTPVARLGAHDLDRLYAQLARDGVGVAAIRHVHAAMSAALTQAVRWEWVPTNVARAARPPAAPRSRATATPDDLLGRLLAVVGDDDRQVRLWVTLAVVTGARRSEVLALRWSDVDWERRDLLVRRSLSPTRDVIPTKTGRERRVRIDAATVDELRAWRLAQRERAMAAGVALVRDPWVLSDDMDCGRPWRPDVATRRWSRLCAAAGVGGLRLHDARHGAVTRLLRAGVPINAVAARVGHSRVSTTLDIYGHVVGDDEEMAADVMRGAV